MRATAAAFLSRPRSTAWFEPPLFAEIQPALAALKGIDNSFGPGARRRDRLRRNPGSRRRSQRAERVFRLCRESACWPSSPFGAGALHSMRRRGRRESTRFINWAKARCLCPATASNATKRQAFTGRADLKEIPVDRLGSYWPVEFAPGGRRWALDNVGGGTTDVHADFSFSAPMEKWMPWSSTADRHPRLSRS